jgi:hypothetical protein
MWEDKTVERWGWRIGAMHWIAARAGQGRRGVRSACLRRPLKIFGPDLLFCLTTKQASISAFFNC